jgi:hypothetical protein
MVISTITKLTTHILGQCVLIWLEVWPFRYRSACADRRPRCCMSQAQLSASLVNVVHWDVGILPTRATTTASVYVCMIDQIRVTKRFMFEACASLLYLTNHSAPCELNRVIDRFSKLLCIIANPVVVLCAMNRGVFIILQSIIFIIS